MSGKEESSFRLWCQKELSAHFHLIVEDELLDYLLTIETEKDLREYLEDLVGEETSHTVLFIKEFLRHWQLHLSLGGGELSRDDGPTRSMPPQNRRDKGDSTGPTRATPSYPTPPMSSMQELEQLSHERMVLFAKEPKEVGLQVN